MLKILPFVLLNEGVTPMKVSKATIIKPNGSLTAMNSNELQSELSQAIKQSHTEFLLLDMENIDDIASCSINRYLVEEKSNPTLTCDEFRESGCNSKNDDLFPVLTDKEGACVPSKLHVQVA